MTDFRALPEPELPTADPYLDNCSKAVLNRARQIDEMLAVNVSGPDTEPDTCASSWFTSKLIANLEERISIIEELQEQIHSLRISYLRLANAVAHIAPDRAKFFADLNTAPPLTDQKILEVAKTCGFIEMIGERDDETDGVYYECWEEQLLKFARAIRLEGAQ